MLYWTSGLRVLSLADNRLSDVGSELELCKAVLTCLSLRSNCMTSLPVQLGSLSSLRELDVSGNRLTSLDGLQVLHACPLGIMRGRHPNSMASIGEERYAALGRCAPSH